MATMVIDVAAVHVGDVVEFNDGDSVLTGEVAKISTGDRAVQVKWNDGYPDSWVSVNSSMVDRIGNQMRETAAK